MFNIWRVPVAGGPAEQMTTQLTMHPAVSPKDGEIAAGIRADVAKPSWKIAIFNPDGSGPVKLFDAAPTVRPDSALHWTPKADAYLVISMIGRGVEHLGTADRRAGTEASSRHSRGERCTRSTGRKDGRMVYSRGMSTSDVVLIRDRSIAKPR